MQDLKDQRVLVIGGSSGIGEATAAAATQAGAKVTIAARDADRLAAAAAGIGAVDTAELDITDESALEDFFVDGEPWRHIVVSSAQTAMGPMRDMPLDDAYAAMHSKFWGAYRVARIARLDPTGSLTFISGFLSDRPSAQAVLQGAINAALEALARGLALELAPVRVNAVSPGMIDTPLWHKLPDDERRQAFRHAADTLPVARVGQPEDIANAVMYLLATGFATGSTVRVDGGGAIA